MHRDFAEWYSAGGRIANPRHSRLPVDCQSALRWQCQDAPDKERLTIGVLESPILRYPNTPFWHPAFSCRPTIARVDQGSGTGGANCPLEMGGEFGEGLGDFGRLLDQGSQHPLGHLRFVADQFDRGHNQGQMVVDVVAHVGEAAIEFGELFDGQSDRLTRQAHYQHWPETRAERKRLSRSCIYA